MPPRGGRPGGPQIDWMKIAWNGRWLIVLGVLAGLGGGYFHFVQTPPLFRSAARIQIVEPVTRNLPVAGVDGTQSGKRRSLADEALVIRSESILQRAATLGDLASTPEFYGRPVESIAASLSGEALTISPPRGSDGDSILEISYDSTSPQTSQRVVQAVVDAYGQYLQEQYRNVGQETLELIQTARDEVLTKLNTLEAEFGQFKQQSGLVFRDGAATSIHRDNADQLLAQRRSLAMEKGRLQSQLEAANAALEGKRPVEAVLVALQMSADVNQERSRMASDAINRMKEANQTTASERMQREQLLPLQLQRDELAASVGKDHPALRTLDQRIAAMQSTIDQIILRENEYRQELNEAWALQDSERGSQADPQEVMRDKVKIGIMALEQQLETLEQEEQLVTEAYLTEVDQARSEAVAEAQSATYFREIDRQQQLYDRIMSRLDEVNLVADGTGLKLFPLTTAGLGYQFAPSVPKSLLGGALLGAMVAMGLAVLRDLSDRSYRSASDIAEHVGLPVIGHVPVLPAKRKDDNPAFANIDPHICTIGSGARAKAEAFRALRTAIYFSNQGGNIRVLQVTSSTPGEGKSTIAANLAATIAQAGRNVLLLDADLRRPNVHKVMGVDCEKGVVWALEQLSQDPGVSDSRLAEAIVETPVANLSLMVAGDYPDNPAELLSAPAFEQLLNRLREKFDMIIVDTPPLLAVSDPSNVAGRADGVIMVVRLRKNIKPLVARATRMLETLQANVLGVVVNGVGSRQAKGYGKDSDLDGYHNHGPYYGYGYGYSYGNSLGGHYGEYYQDAASKRQQRQRNQQQAAGSRQ